MRFRRNPPDLRVLPQMDPYDERDPMSADEATAVLLAWKAAGSPKVSIEQIVSVMSGRRRNDV